MRINTLQMRFYDDEIRARSIWSERVWWGHFSSDPPAFFNLSFVMSLWNWYSRGSWKMYRHFQNKLTSDCLRFKIENIEKRRQDIRTRVVLERKIKLSDYLLSFIWSRWCRHIVGWFYTITQRKEEANKTKVILWVRFFLFVEQRKKI